MSYLTAIGRPQMDGLRILEVGTGWYPVLPVCFVLAGARQCISVDLNRHVDPQLTLRMVQQLEASVDKLSRTAGQRVETVIELYRRIAASKQLDQLLSAANIDYKAPADATSMPWLDDESVDIVYSNSVLEHVEVDVLPGIMREAWRILRPGGVMVHAVACNDHYAHFDRSISFVNFLQFSDTQWKKWNNSLNFQNRLRASDFLNFAKKSGFRIVHEARSVRPGVEAALTKLTIAPEFASYSREDLSATSIDFVAEK
jgi:SAM-dependent methyltransferase